MLMLTTAADPSEPAVIAGVLEGAFIKQLKVIAPALIGKAKLITELSDEAAEKALAEIHSILAEEVAE